MQQQKNSHKGALVLVSSLIQGRRAVKRGSLSSCQQAKELIRVNSFIIWTQILYSILHGLRC